MQAARVTVAEQPAVEGHCALCGDAGAALSSAVLVTHARGGTTRFEACGRCARATRRILAAVGEGAPVAAATPRGAVPSPTSARSVRTVRSRRPGPVTPAEVILEPAVRLQAGDGAIYAIRVLGRARAGGTWEGWIEFRPIGGAAGRPRRTGRETTQPDRTALLYWAGGLEPVYFDGAFARAS